MTQPRPTLRHERALHRSGMTRVAAMDEVGRGALAGPVSVGVVITTPGTFPAPLGVADSKLLRPAAREALCPRIRRWADDYAVGHASAAEIDERGIIAALRLAGQRALAALSVAPDIVLLDGSHDWLTDPAGVGLFGLLPGVPQCPPVVTRVKADLTCASVAAASVLAKVERDALMCELAGAEDRYGWIGNKGYAAPDHLEALRTWGTCEQHRRSWRLAVLAEKAELSGCVDVDDLAAARPAEVRSPS